jgi:hypothetical protein
VTAWRHYVVAGQNTNYLADSDEMVCFPRQQRVKSANSPYTETEVADSPLLESGRNTRWH